MELKATELRIGNFVEYQRNDILTELKQVKGVNWGGDSIFIEYYNQDGSQYPINKKHFKPIPLTEEWLVKFGLKKMDISEYTLNTYDFADFTLWLNDDKFLFNDKTNIKYVHQLQNLYFALTQKELLTKK